MKKNKQTKKQRVSSAKRNEKKSIRAKKVASLKHERRKKMEAERNLFLHKQEVALRKLIGDRYNQNV